MSVTFDQRKFLGGSTSTPAGVGPGLYDLAAAYDALATSSKNAASSSFLSKSSKNNPRWNYVVGPGAYEASSGFGAMSGNTTAGQYDLPAQLSSIIGLLQAQTQAQSQPQAHAQQPRGHC